ncbi:hypothetical protein DDV21_007825 [Streptococcus chenjunshii]|uniref:GGDEF domain-containing protein n=1 Tax=Streptococcus chenjunshii TaxID=2173853 RepID=A0A372KMW8_9STRE|nr:hypothetical protein [Streptococcus chenjunshii]AXQ79000.1 hypothetical protein DDV21_007825 [Streptococcus chenjunshii]RFU51427.1 hypothetical protein DDV22_03715 [Streptococcus chenjunshii]RFU53627.1 hypothetical protein DDV23_03705 [Streptococcus chenjunshii]
MYQKKYLVLETLGLILLSAALIIFTFALADGFLYEILILLILALLSAVFLSDMMVTWLVLFSLALSTIILVAGVVYIPFYQRFLLAATFPLILGLTKRLAYQHHLRLSKVKDETQKAYDYYRDYTEMIETESEAELQLYLLHWAHNDYFEQIHSKEFRRMLKRIKMALYKYCNYDSKIFYLSDGDFIILSSDSSLDFRTFFQQQVLPELATLHFRNSKSLHEIQYQGGYILINKANLQEYRDLDDVLNNLLRQLETDIIVEY